MSANFELERYQDPMTIQRIPLGAKTVAIVGLSSNPLRASYFVGFYLQRHGYQIIPVNPVESQILGVRSYPTLREIPTAVDIVDVFRNPAALPPIAKDAVAIGAKCLWGQYSVINPEAARIAESAGLAVIMDRCLKVEHARYLGRMHWLGFNTQRITSLRAG